jgi:hypothetical protein
MQLTDKVYERLTPDERFRAAIEAFARRDVKEVDRLADTCGYTTLRIHGHAYFGRLRGFHELSMMHGLLVRDMAIVVMGSAYQLERAETDTPEGSEAQNEALDHMVHAAVRIKAYVKAWEDFCAELAIEPEKTLLTFYEPSKEVVAFFDSLEDLEADAETYVQHLGFLRDTWRNRLEKMPSNERRQSIGALGSHRCVLEQSE